MSEKINMSRKELNIVEKSIEELNEKANDFVDARCADILNIAKKISIHARLGKEFLEKESNAAGYKSARLNCIKSIFADISADVAIADRGNKGLIRYSEAMSNAMSIMVDIENGQDAYTKYDEQNIEDSLVALEQTYINMMKFRNARKYGDDFITTVDGIKNEIDRELESLAFATKCGNVDPMLVDGIINNISELAKKKFSAEDAYELRIEDEAKEKACEDSAVKESDPRNEDSAQQNGREYLQFQSVLNELSVAPMYKKVDPELLIKFRHLLINLFIKDNGKEYSELLNDFLDEAKGEAKIPDSIKRALDRKTPMTLISLSESPLNDLPFDRNIYVSGLCANEDGTVIESSLNLDINFDKFTEMALDLFSNASPTNESIKAIYEMPGMSDRAKAKVIYRVFRSCIINDDVYQICVKGNDPIDYDTIASVNKNLAYAVKERRTKLAKCIQKNGLKKFQKDICIK